MYSLKYVIIENSKSKEIKKAAIVVLVIISLIIIGVYAKPIIIQYPITMAFSLFILIAYIVFNNSYKTYNIIGYFQIEPDKISIQSQAVSQILDITNIEYIEFRFKGFIGSNNPGEIATGSLYSSNGTGNILEIGANSTVYKLNCLLEDEMRANVLIRHLKKLNKEVAECRMLKRTDNIK